MSDLYKLLNFNCEYFFITLNSLTILLYPPSHKGVDHNLVTFFFGLRRDRYAANLPKIED